MDLITEFLGGHRYFCHWYDGKKKYGNQLKVRDKEEVIHLIERYNGLENCGISISTFIDGVPHLLYLPFDFDSTNLRESFDDSRRLYNKMVEWGYKASFHFSGGKGFHVLIPIIPKPYTKYQLLKTQQFFKRLLNLKTADEQIFRDVRRIIRIPGTFHVNGNLCDIFESNDEGDLLDIESFSPPDFKKYGNTKKVTTKPIRRIQHDFPCIERLVKDRDYWERNNPKCTFEPFWMVRFAWVIEQNYRGKTEDEMLQDIESFGWDDYEYDKSLYNIRYVLENDYIHPSCETLKEYGLCIIKNCPYNAEWKGKRLNDKEPTIP